MSSVTKLTKLLKNPLTLSMTALAVVMVGACFYYGGWFTFLCPYWGFSAWMAGTSFTQKLLLSWGLVTKTWANVLCSVGATALYYVVMYYVLNKLSGCFAGSEKPKDPE